MKKLSYKQWALHILGAVIVLLSRMKMLPVNYSPLGSYGFFSGNILLYFGSIVVFDYFVGGFYQGVLYTYAGFAAYYVFGFIARKSTKRQIILLPVASLAFFFISNFGVWLAWYPHTIAGFLECYTLALPFFKNTFLGDLGFGYGWMLVQTMLLPQVPYLWKVLVHHRQPSS